MLEIDVKYYSTGKFSCSYIEFWDKTELYCPHCGKQEVWSETGEGDYYLGTVLLCLSCEHGFHLPNDTWEAKNEQQQQILREIRAHNKTLHADRSTGANETQSGSGCGR